MRRSPILLVSALLTLAAPVILGSAAGTDPPRVELLDRPGREFDPYSHSHGYRAHNEPVGPWSRIVEACSGGEVTERYGDRAVQQKARCRVEELGRAGGYRLHGMMGEIDHGPGDFDDTLFSRLYAANPESGESWLLFSMESVETVAYAWMPERLETPLGPVVRVPLRISGTGAFNDDVYFLLEGSLLREIDAKSWRQDLELPPDHGIWKGVVVDVERLRASTPVWREGDGNCCPSGGKIEVELELRERALRVERQVHTPPDPNEWR